VGVRDGRMFDLNAPQREKLAWLTTATPAALKRRGRGANDIWVDAVAPGSPLFFSRVQTGYVVVAP
jgi:hypothetical protein